MRSREITTQVATYQRVKVFNRKGRQERKDFLISWRSLRLLR
jgi:hypothetical protein